MGRRVCTSSDSIGWLPTKARTRMPRGQAPCVSSLVWCPGGTRGGGGLVRGRACRFGADGEREAEVHCT
eukprot:7275475-Pyramimonas_sp.AAC.1